MTFFWTHSDMQLTIVSSARLWQASAAATSKTVRGKQTVLCDVLCELTKKVYVFRA